MLHHVSFGVANLVRAADFYDAALRELGYARVWTNDDAVGYGLPDGGDKLAIKQVGTGTHAPGAGFHLALAAPSRESVDAFHRVALSRGGVDNGAPGLRPRYGPSYYAAFVVDPDGHRIEAVINDPR